MAGKSKVEQGMSVNELQEFCKELANAKGLTLARIQELAAKRGIEISIMGAKRFRDSTLDEYLTKVSKASEIAMQIAAVNNADSGATLADTAATILMKEVLDDLIQGIDGEGKVDYNTVSKIIARLRSGDHRLIKLQAELNEFKAREAARAEAKAQLGKDLKKSAGGLSPEALAEIEERLKLL